MASDDVPPGEMHRFGSTRDPLDAALRGDSGDPAVTALVHDLRSAYLPDEPRRRSAALVAFAGRGAGERPVVARPVPTVAAPTIPVGRRVAAGVAAFAATMTGKVVLAGAVAAATVGGLHASEVIDVPLLPHSPRVESTPATTPELPEAVDPLSVLGRPAPPVEGPDEADGPRVPGAVAPTTPGGTTEPAVPDAKAPAGDVGQPGPGVASTSPPTHAPAPKTAGEPTAPPAGPAEHQGPAATQGSSRTPEPRSDAPDPRSEPAAVPGGPDGTAQEDHPRP